MSLESLTQYYGILNSYVDARGTTQTATRETKLALLAAMGVTVSDEASAAHVLRRLQTEDAALCIPPVHVHYRTSGPLDLEVKPLEVKPSAASPREWRIELEGGQVQRGMLQHRAQDGDDDDDDDEAPAWRCFLRVEAEIPCGYHTVILEPGEFRCSLIVTPGQCWLPAGVEAGGKLWGVAAQLYLLRSESNWGIGDYADLERLVRTLAANGADVVGLNPLHAMFADAPQHASPYSPASRLLLNVLNIDVAAVARSMSCEAARTRMSSRSFQEALAHCRDADLVDYAGVAALKLPLLQELFECCDRAAQRWQSFLAFRSAAGGAFERSCLYLALRSRFAKESPSIADWHRWPEEYRRADSPATLQFAHEHAEAVTFQAWLQFVADQQLQECSAAAAGMAIGLYRDLAVGAALDGAETWANPAAVIDSVHVGAPPDIYNPQGQDWGLPAFDPRALRAEGYRSFIELVRANMRHAGGLRIDHVMALQQLYWVPAGRPASEGGYVRYPLDDLIGILALESQRHECLVVGEDLGTVPDGFRERLQRGNILSYRVLFFEKDEDGFIAPGEYPRLALAVAGSHDLPTLRAWWLGADLALKERLHLYPTETHAVEAKTDREADRIALEHLLRKHRLISSDRIDADAFAEAAHAFLAGTRSAVTLLQLDDLTGEVDPVNVPTTSHEHPNWRRRLSLGMEQLDGDSRFRSAMASMSDLRTAG